MIKPTDAKSPTLRDRVLARCGSALVRLWGRTLHFETVDHAGALSVRDDNQSAEPLIWVFWHNRILFVPYWFRRFSGRRGAVLTSASRDGALLAAIAETFGLTAVRGSSSRRGARALLELRRAIRSGLDIGITPDGPRGPRYGFALGALLLARTSGVPVVPLQVDLGSFAEIRSWDRFRLPRPFSSIRFTIHKPVTIPPDASDETLEDVAARLTQILGIEQTGQEGRSSPTA